MDFGFWVSGFRFWALGAVFSVSGFGFRKEIPSGPSDGDLAEPLLESEDARPHQLPRAHNLLHAKSRS